MDINLKITIAATPELIGVFNSILNSGTPAPVVNMPRKEKASANVSSAIQKEAEESAAGDTNGITIETLRAAASSKSKNGKKAEVKKLLSKFEADSVSVLAKERYADFLKEVNDL
jgi:hypothetical protein